MNGTIEASLPQYICSIGPGRWRVCVWAQPGARKNGIAGEYQGRLKVRLSAPAVDNKANKALVVYIAGLLGVRKSSVHVSSGRTSRAKTLEIVSEAGPDWSALAPDAAA